MLAISDSNVQHHLYAVEINLGCILLFDSAPTLDIHTVPEWLVSAKFELRVHGQGRPKSVTGGGGGMDSFTLSRNGSSVLPASNM